MKSINSNQYQKNPYNIQQRQMQHIKYSMTTPNMHQHQQNEQQDTNQPIQLFPYDSMQIKCKKLEEINQNLKYNISMLEIELDLLKKIQKEKIDQNKKVKEKGKSKLQKQFEIKRHIKVQNDRLTKLISGYRLLKNQATQMQNREQKTRENRLKAQEMKNQTYEQYNNIEKQYKQLIFNIKQRDGLLQQLDRFEKQNQSLNNQIQQLEQLLNQEQTSRNDVANLKKQRNSKVKQLNIKVLQLQKQENNIKNQIHSIENNLQIWQTQKHRIQQKATEELKLYQQIQEARSLLASKRSQFSEVDSTYKQLCLQQTRMKKQIILERQCNEARRKYKQGLKIGKPLSSPKMQKAQNIKKLSPQRSEELQNKQMNKLQILAKRFENLNNKNRR